MLLSLSEIESYAPELVGKVTTADLLALDALIASPELCGRSLAITPYTEIRSLNKAYQSVYLSYMPVLPSPAISVWSRTANAFDPYGVPVAPATEWVALQSSEFGIDYTYGKIELFQQFGTQIKVSYSAGFDLSAATSQIQRIKAMAAVLLSWMSGTQGKSGIASQSVSGWYSVSYAGASNSANVMGRSPSLSGGMPEFALKFFRKFRPRDF
jgi:hypothetical protein